MALEVKDITPSDELKPVGNAVLVVVDIQGGGLPSEGSGTDSALMPGRAERDAKAVEMVAAFRAAGKPVVFVQEVRKPSLIDIGRERDGAEGVHCLEGDPRTELHPGLEPRPEEYLVQKRRYSAFYGTDLDIVLKGYGAETVIFIGGATDVCVHYTSADAHQLDYHFRTVSDMVVGTSVEAHEAGLRAMKYLQRDSLVTSTSVYDWLAAA